MSWDSILEVEEETTPGSLGPEMERMSCARRKGRYPGVLTVIILLTLTQKLGRFNGETAQNVHTLLLTGGVMSCWERNPFGYVRYL